MVGLHDLFFAVLGKCQNLAGCGVMARNMPCSCRQLEFLPTSSAGSLEATHREAAVGLKGMLEGLQLAELGQQLAATPAGLDPALGRCLRCAVAFHHAGGHDLDGTRVTWFLPPNFGFCPGV